MQSPLEHIHPRNLKHLAFYLEGLLEGRLWAKILVAMVLGIGVGILLGPTVGIVPARWAVPLGEWLALPGLLFLTVIQMIVVPLVIAAVVRGLAASSDLEQLKRGGMLLAGFFIGTTVLATILGIVLGLVLRPGSFVDPAIARSLATGDAPSVETFATSEISVATLPSQIISILPTNPLGAMVEGQMLQVVLFSLLLGVALITVAPSTSKPLLDLMGSLQGVCMAIVGWVMRLAPYAVFGLLARVMLSTGLGVLIGVAAYVASVLLGLALLMVLFVAIAVIWGRRRPGAFLRDIRDAQLIAFSTDSSAATLPVSIRTAEEKLGVRPSIAQLVLPLGASVNMGGTALYQGLATMFMAQLFGLSLPLSSLVALVVTALGASIGAPATPGVGIVVLATVLQASGIPLAGLTLILGVDQIIERARTVLNVTGDLVAATVMDRALPEGDDREHQS
ncbi:MAG TPA: dicarboxylate/amino acid:cation symporter [Gammaproteobacteria bacterium]|nr:dicarboxylate/amino acid:cation symporter [Gammaproteobacteria bacterium]